MSHRGAVPPVDEQIQEGKEVVAHSYRNRRIGEYLKELDLTEGRSTGLKVIQRMMENNGSPPAIFETEDSYFMTTLKIHPDAKSHAKIQPKKNKIKLPEVFTLEAMNGVLEQAVELLQQSDYQLEEQVSNYAGNYVGNYADLKIVEVLKYCKTARSRSEILEKKLNIGKQTKNYNKYIRPLFELKWIDYTIPKVPKSPNQKYLITEKGQLFLELINREE